MKRHNYFWNKKALLSFIAVIFVVIIHNSSTRQYNTPPDVYTNITHYLHDFLSYGIGGVAVPIFFFLSGLTMFRNFSLNKYSQKLKSRIKTLLIPYLIWNTVGLLFIIVCTYTPLSNYITGRELFVPSFANVFKGIFLYKYNFQFWFLFELMIFTLLAPCFYYCIKNKFLGLIIGIALFFLPLINHIIPESYLNLNFNYVIFYYIGCFIGKHYFNKFSQSFSRLSQIIAFLTLIVTLTLRTLSVYNILQFNYASSQLILLILLISIYVSFDLFIQKNKTPKPFYHEFFPIYTLHTYLLSIIIKIIYLSAPKTSWMLLINECFSTVFTVITITYLSTLLHQKLPKTYQLLFGRTT